MTRQIVFDTETTGLPVEAGHRVIEIGCVEIVDRRISDRHFHAYLNPDRQIDAGAIAVHGISDESLVDKPHFADIAEQFLAFIDGAELIAHNANFDVGFLDAEFGRWSPNRVRVADRCLVTDTLELARQRYPGQRNNLDALCKRLGIDLSRRTVHGALLDARLLAECYLAMTGGQIALELPSAVDPLAAASSGQQATVSTKAVSVSDEEQLAHQNYLERLRTKNGGLATW
ncbi:DNA polymerase III subunit epsilon [Gammaproteobacteria bacterium]|nr:DNA polymerase III subunit epsilon [Gammaproteobacteria bacterium]